MECTYESLQKTMKRRKENKSANKVKTPNQVRKLIQNQSFLSIVKANIMGKSSNIIQINLNNRLIVDKTFAYK